MTHVVGVTNEDGALKIGGKTLNGRRKVGIGHGTKTLSGECVEERGSKRGRNVREIIIN